jgi:hypothetical protein
MTARITARSLLLIFVSLIGCRQAGHGEARLNTPASAATPAPAVHFEWHRHGIDLGSGDMRALFPGSRVYAGPFAQVRAQLETDTTGTRFIAWLMPSWARDDPWFAPPSTCEGVNSRALLALLTQRDGSALRCQFKLARPDAGISGGASGRCQLSRDGSIVDVALAPARWRSP